MSALTFLLLALEVTVPRTTNVDFEAHVKNLAAGVGKAQIDASLEALWRGGKDAFPALVAHVNDPTPADDRFQEPRVDRRTGKVVRPTIGRASFGILQVQIEGRGPWVFRQFHGLTPRNAKKWLETHQEKSLSELRQLATAQALRRAEAELKRDPTNATLQSAVEFFQEDYLERERRLERQLRNPFEF